MRTRIAGSLLLVGVCILAAPLLTAQTSTPVTCTNASLSGVHGLTLTGRNVSSTSVISTAELGVGTVNFDGNGNVTIQLTTNTASTTGISQTLSGTYSLPSNCLGTMSITTGDTASFTLIPYNSGNGFSMTGQDATYSITATGTAQPPQCVTATLTGQYTFTGNGYTLASGTITGVNTISGVLQFDGAGNIVTSGSSWSISTDGATTTTPTVTGKYTVAAPGCTASATLTDSNGLSYTMAITETNATAADFSAVLASAANTFTINSHSAFTYPGLAVELISGNDLAVPAGSLFSVYGFNLSTGTNQATKFPLPGTLSGATIKVNGETAPIYNLDNTALGTEGLINAQMPLDIQPGVATLVVTNGTAVSNAVAVNIPATANPAVLIYGNNHALAQNLPSYALNSDSAPAARGSSVTVYLTGAGPVQGQSLLTTGGQTPGTQLFPVTEAFSATLAGVSISPPNISIALVPTEVGGFYQANITIPSTVSPGDRSLVITIGGKASNSTLLSVN